MREDVAEQLKYLESAVFLAKEVKISASSSSDSAPRFSPLRMRELELKNLTKD